MEDEALIFDTPEPNVQYVERQAAYVVVTDEGKVALVKGQQKSFLSGGGSSPGETPEEKVVRKVYAEIAPEKYFLPGGGSLPDEAPEETVVREVTEELAREVRVTRRIGETIQYFYSAADDRHYQMRATFFVGEFMDEPGSAASEHEVHWLPVSDVEQACFHACHAWAVRQA